MNLSHEQTRELIQKSLQARLDAFEAKALTAHLADCPQCAAYADEVRALDRQISTALSNRWPEPRFSTADLDRKLAGMQNRLRRESMFRTASSFARFAGAAALLIMLIAGLTWLVNSTTRPTAIGGAGKETPTAAQPASPTAGVNVSTVTPAPTRDRNGSLSLPEAEKIVRETVFAEQPGMNPDATFPLKEITPDEVWQRMAAQVFKVTGGVQMNETYVIVKGKAYHIGMAFGDQGVDQMAVADLDGNGAPELVFIYTFGSGIRQSSLGLFDSQRAEPGVYGLLNQPNFWGQLSLEKRNDQDIRLTGVETGKTDVRTLGVVRYVDNQLVVTADYVPLKTFSSDVFNISFQYPADWRIAHAADNHTRYEGSSGFFDLYPLGAGTDYQDLQRRCEWEANSHASQYGDQPEINFIAINQQFNLCVIHAPQGSGRGQSAVLFLAGNRQIAALAVDTGHVDLLAQTLHFMYSLPTPANVPINMTPQPPNTSRQVETRAVGPLTLNEYAVVKSSEDTPGHFEFNDRIPKDVFPERFASYMDDVIVSSNNTLLAPFGYRIEVRKEAQGQTQYDLYQGSKAIKTGLNAVQFATVYEPGNTGSANGADFAMLVEDGQGAQWLMRKHGIEAWDSGLHRFTRPVFNGSGNLITVERDPSLNNADRVLVKQDGQTVFTYNLTLSPVEEPVKRLASWNGGWVLEVNGTLIVNGSIWNLKDFPADEIFNWTMLNGKPFFFFRRDGKVGAWYDGKELPVQYEAVMHYKCCEPAAFNIATYPDAVRFYALRDGMWYLAEIQK